MTQPNLLERAVLMKLFEGDGRSLEELRRQAQNAEVVSRWLSGAGFVTRFSVGESALEKSARIPDVIFGDVGASNIPGLEYGAGFLVTVSGGKLSSLEGYSFEDCWPDKVDTFTLFYHNDRGEVGVRQIPPALLAVGGTRRA